MPAKFPLGAVVITPNARDRLDAEHIKSALRRHVAGDWGDLDAHDRQVNEDALVADGRLFSAYTSSNGTTFWIITESDRSATTILLPDDY